MVTTIRKVTGGDYPFYEFACLSTDTKPTSLVPENSLCREIDTGKMFYFSGSAWHEAPARGGSDEDGGLPDNFPAEGSENANKFLGFNANGAYTAKDAPSGGGAEKFVVTLTEENGTWTADKTIAEIAEAYEAGQIVVCSVWHDVVAYEIPCAAAAAIGDGAYAAIFGGVTYAEEAQVTIVRAQSDGGIDEWLVENNSLVGEVPSYSSSQNGKVLGVSSGSLAWVDNYAPLVVTLTAGSTEGQLVGDKTYKEVYDAFMAGQNCILNAPAMLGAFAVLSVGYETDYAINAYGDISASGAANDYITITAGD